jgi:hypothetical protein
MTAYEKHGPARPGIRPLTCSVCGSVWFRSATFLASYPQARLKAPLLVCLCGTVVTPRLSGSQRADQDEIDRLSAALANVRSRCQAIADAAVLAEVAVSATATLTSKIARLERSAIGGTPGANLVTLEWRWVNATLGKPTG